MRSGAVLDDAFTYGGGLVAASALCGAAWLALRLYPSFETFVRGFDDEMHLSDTAEERAWAARRARVGRVTLILALVGAVSLAIGYAIPG